MALICDTGVLYGAMDRRDPAHGRCARLLTDTRESIVVPAPVVIELEWLATARMGPAPFDEFLEDIERRALAVADLTLADYGRTRRLITRYADLALGFVDAAVVAVAERLGEAKLATLDVRHFSVVRPRHVESFTLLP